MRTRLAPLLLLAAANSVCGESFTPESAAIHALRANPDLLAARHLIAEAEARLVQAGLWPNPTFEARAEFDGRNGAGDRRFEGSFLQRFPWSGRLGHARNAARVDVAMAIEELRDQERRLAGRVLGQARAVLAVDRRLALNAENRELLERIFRQTGTLTATGKATAAEARVIELEQATVALARETLEVERRARLAELNGLLGRTPDAPFTLAGTLPAAPAKATLRAAAAAAPRQRPDRQLAALQTDKAQAEERLAQAGRWEDVELGTAFTREREDGVYDSMAGVSVSIPLPLWNRNQGRIAETQAARQRSAAALAALDLAIATEVREAEMRVAGLGAVLNRTRGPALDLARQTTRLIEETYAAGTAAFVTVFESRKQVLALEQSAVETEEALATAISEWETRTGHFPASVQAVLASSGHRRPRNLIAPATPPTARQAP